jgi:hypothetical protein
MIESIALTREQIDSISVGDWMQITEAQRELIATAGDNRRCTVVGEELVRMPLSEFKIMLKNAFRAGFHHAMHLLGITDQNLVEHVDMSDWNFGDSHFSVTLRLFDGRTQTGKGFFAMPVTVH